jgi:hypothetical protein
MPAKKPVSIEPIPAPQIQQWKAKAADSGSNFVEVLHGISREIREALKERGVEVFDDVLYTVNGKESIDENRPTDEGMSIRHLDLGTMEWSDPHEWKSRYTRIQYVIQTGKETGLEL